MSETEVPAEPAATVRHLIEEAANNGNGDVVHETFAESVEPLQDYGSDTITPEDLWSGLSNIRDAMPDLHHEIKTVRRAGDRVYVEYTMTGTFENEWELEEATVEPTGEDVSMDGVIVTRFDGDTIDGWANFGQSRKAFEELGIVPSVEELAE